MEFSAFYQNQRMTLKMDINVSTHTQVVITCQEDPFLMFENEFSQETINEYIKSNFEDQPSYSIIKKTIFESLIPNLSDVQSINQLKDVKQGDICILVKTDSDCKLDFVTLRCGQKIQLLSIRLQKAQAAQISSQIYSRYQLLQQDYQNMQTQLNQKISTFIAQDKQSTTKIQALEAKIETLQKQAIDHQLSLQQNEQKLKMFEKVEEQLIEQQKVNIELKSSAERQQTDFQEQKERLNTKIKELEQTIHIYQKQQTQQQFLPSSPQAYKERVSNTEQIMQKYEQVTEKHHKFDSGQLSVTQLQRSYESMQRQPTPVQAQVQQTVPLRADVSNQYSQYVKASQLSNQQQQQQYVPQQRQIPNYDSRVQQSQYTPLADNPVMQRLRNLDGRGSVESVMQKYSQFLK
ncbi:Hypothetical_protein [Hexamita inflata]|uniref:Hypothetical_protein n=1 Tax=Hexamita inflata TaxID=28002 RepID=A0AA86P4K8_9EUKA|nr:Hypothetical protein HINF_LOCUS18950 [Hexamita inflata]